MMAEVPPRLAPLLAQLDTSLEMAVDRMRGLTDDEFWWKPEPGAVSVAPDEHGRLGPRRPPGDEDEPRTRTVALLLGHLGDMGFMRADYTDGDHRLRPGDLAWPADAAAGMAFFRDGWSRWRSALAGLPDADLDVVGRCSFPQGLDPTLPILDIAWWMNRELIHHTAEIAFIRDLYARTVAGSDQ